MNIIQNGALLDTRNDEEKAKDYTLKEVAGGGTVPIWEPKSISEWRRFPIYNQDGSGSCVAQTEAKEMGIMRWLKDGEYVHFSATDIYQRRANKPYSGMGAIDARNIVRNGGATLEVLAPSQGMNDDQMDDYPTEAYKREVGEVFKVPNYIALTAGSIEEVASTIQATGKGVMVWFYFKNDEWTSTPKVIHTGINNVSPGVVRHSVTAVDFTLVNGKKCLIIEDSWGPGAGIGGCRVITEEFYEARNWYAGYLVNFRYETPSNKPMATFDTDMQLGQMNGDIIDLQDCLKYEQVFPENIGSTGYYGGITQKAVQDFQKKYGIATDGVPGYGRCGPKTREKLNSIFSF